MLTAEIDPAEAGFDPQRLARIDRLYSRYVDEGKLPGFQAVVARDGKIVHVAQGGMADIEAEPPVADDTLWRIYSMTKPITSVAAMLLWEEGAFELKDPVANFIPAFADAQVWAGGNQNKPITRPAVEPVRIWHLLTHTAGLTYGFHYAHPLDGVYRQHGYEFGSPRTTSPRPSTRWARLPLLFEPGTEFNYSVATDVLGRLVEVLSGQSLDTFFQERIFGPLGMTDTTFSAGRPATGWPRSTSPGLKRNDRMGSHGLRAPDDALRRRRARSAPPPTTTASRRCWSRTARRCSHPVRSASWPATTCRVAPSSRTSRVRPSPRRRTTAWASASASPSSWTPRRRRSPPARASSRGAGWRAPPSSSRPEERLSVQFFTQMIPSSTYPLRSQLRQLVYQAMTD